MSPLASLLLRVAGGLVFTVSAMGAGCEPNGGGGTTGPSESSGPDGSSSIGASGSSSGVDPTGVPTTSSPTTNGPTTNGTEPGSSDSDPDSGSETNGGACAASGEYVGVLVDRADDFGHFSFLKLFYAPDAPEQTVDEIFVVDIAPDGTVTVELVARDSGTGEGHAGLAGLQGTIGPDCAVEANGELDFSSDTGPFGTITVDLTGALPPSGTPTFDLTLQGGGIPNGPITYFTELTPN